MVTDDQVKLAASDPIPASIEAIRYPLADLDGQLVWARDLAENDDRPKGLRCVGCEGSLTLRAGARRRPHFAHRASDTCTGGETALHRTAIRVIATALAEAMRHGRPYPFELACRLCDASRDGDLARDAASVVEVDRILSSGIRPDLLIRGSDNVPRVAIEVVVTHAPEHGALAEYDALGLTIIAVYPTWDALESMREGLLHLSSHSTQGAHIELLGRCPFGRHLSNRDGELRPCSRCDAPSRVVTVEVSEAPCWGSRCARTVRVLDTYARINGRRVVIAAGAGDLHGVKEIAGEMAVKVTHRTSSRAGTSYLMHMCECGAPSGDNFVYGGFGSEPWTPSMNDPVRRYEVCANGHWEPQGARPWHPSTRAGRSQSAMGLIGESAGLFGDVLEEPLVTFTSFATPSEAARFLTRRFR
jgi:hypothetical protein